MLANLVCSLIEHKRIKTTLAKAKAVRPLAEKMVTLGKKDTLHARRTAMAVLRQNDAVKKLFADVAPRAPTARVATPASSSSASGRATRPPSGVHRMGRCRRSRRGNDPG